MMLHRFIAFVAILAVSVCASAKQQFTSLYDAVRKSDAIVIASSIKPVREKARWTWSFAVDAKTCLKGELERGVHRVVTVDVAPVLGPYRFPVTGIENIDCIVFLQKRRGGLHWRFVGWPCITSAPDSETLFMVNGFTYGNRHVVYPNAVTLPQLKTLIAHGKLQYTLKGPLSLAKPGSFEQTTREIELFVQYNRGRHACEVRGLGPTGAWTVDGVGGIGGDDGRSPDIALSRPRGGRMSLLGTIKRARLGGTRMDCAFWVSSPYFATAKQMEEFLRDEEVIGTDYVLKILVQPRDAEKEKDFVHLKFKGGDAVEGIGVLEGWGSRPLRAKAAMTDELHFPLEEGRSLIFKFGYDTELMNQANTQFDLGVDTRPFMHDGRSWTGDISIMDADGKKTNVGRFRSSLDGVFLVRKASSETDKVSPE